MKTLIIQENAGDSRFSNKFSDALWMKKLILFKVILFILMIFFIANTLGQNNGDIKNRYRVTAFQKDKNQVISVSNEAEINPPAVYYIPNAFTPNGDGLNETFGLIGEEIMEYNMQIFNRWGNLIFESNDVKMQWDGTYHNEKAPVDVYVYKISGKGLSGYGKTLRLINENGIVNLVL